MKIVCFSINPIFSDQVTGGASKHLVLLCKHLAKAMHDITILATQAASGQMPFWLSERVFVKPVLPFHQPFPQPYMVSPPDLSTVSDIVFHELENADKFYIHDGELLLPYLYSKIATIISFRDNFYPESILGSFITEADAIITVSPFSADVIKTTAGRFFPGLINRINTIPNGIDRSFFKPSDPTDILKRFHLDTNVDQVILHPHRPEERKGLLETVMVCEKLVKEYGFEKIRILVPEWLNKMAGETESVFQSKITSEIKKRGLTKNFIFHPWLSQSEMPAYYSAGALTLCLGNIIEAFGNVAYESLACGTPSIVSKVGVHRSQLPDDLIDKVDFGDIESAAKIAAGILSGKKRVSNRRLNRILSFFPYESQMHDYTNVIENTGKLASLVFSPKILNEEADLKLAPWCGVSGTAIYHDYQNRWYHIEKLSRILQKRTNHINSDLAASAGADWHDLKSWFDQSLLVFDD